MIDIIQAYICIRAFRLENSPGKPIDNISILTLEYGTDFPHRERPKARALTNGELNEEEGDSTKE